MKSALALRVVTDRDGVQTLTRRSSGVEFTTTAPGGHDNAKARLDIGLDALTIDATSRVYLTDTRTGRTIWEGYADSPGRAQDTRQGFDLAARGGQVLASDQSQKLIYVDNILDNFTRDDSVDQTPSGSTEVGTRPTDGVPGLILQFPPGQPITTGARAQMVYESMRGSSMAIGGFRVQYVAGQTDANYQLQASVGGDTTYISIPIAASMSTAAVSQSKFASINFATGHTRVSFRLIRAAGGATNIATDNVWAAFTSLGVIGQRLLRDGTLVVHQNTVYVLASEIAEDLLARMLPGCDPTTSTIEASTFQITQMLYPDPTRAAAVLEDLTLFEPDMLWEILESGPTGRHRFNFRAWPTTPRYMVSTKDGYNAPGGEQDVCNRVTVGWSDAKGVKRTTLVSTAVDALDRAGRIRYADPITLDDNVQVAGSIGSAENAQRIGEQLLAQKNTPGLAATVTVDHPIVDLSTGQSVMPWEIEPGYLVRIRETGEDLRLTEMTYSDDDQAASLKLGNPVRSLDQLLVGVQAQRRSA